MVKYLATPIQLQLTPHSLQSKKGLSLEEKRTRLLDLFKETKEFYKLQELEKLAPKTKGITAMSVKEVLQGLVDDGLVKSKLVFVSARFRSHRSLVPPSSLYWHFPSDAAASIISRHSKLKDSVEGMRSRAAAEEEIIASEMLGREETENRAELLQRFDVAQAQLQQLKEEETEYTGCDPRVFASKENVSAALCYIRDQVGVEMRDNLRAQFNIDEEWEDLSFA
ncbi:Mnd1 family-domain-containing protein [Leucosporidium creatinivorum]|uniref:Mnd1 family-domain-containing protein n=1 Tax=Leucosporidium creatinivorum TaxID=106004 RepID=A0A1Y2G4R3_9BASI|nr:Mnd1 family-domain-containing protein [Leucosporidium creatinivorum]